MFESALVPVSLREPEWLVRLLTSFLRNFGTRSLTLVNVVSSGLESASRAEERLRHLGERLGPGRHSISTVVRHGSPALEICNVARERGLGYICIPWRRKSVMQRTLLGNTTVNVARMTDVPLFVYKPWGPEMETARLQSVLYATTLDPEQDRVVPYLREEGFAAKHLYLLHVGWRAPDPESETRRRETIFERLKTIEAACQGCFESVHAITAVGDPRRRILRAARECGVELIVLGKHAQTGPLAGMLGSTAERVVHEARVSVLVVPTGETQIGGNRG